MSRNFNSEWLRQYQMKTAKQHNAGVVGEVEVAAGRDVGLAIKKRIRQSSKPLMNKLEAEFYEHIRGLYPNLPPVRCQAKRYRLGNGIWYKPDFTASWPGRGASETAWEVKGPHAFRGGLENLKVAACLYPEICWLLVWKDSTGQWNEQRILP